MRFQHFSEKIHQTKMQNINQSLSKIRFIKMSNDVENNRGSCIEWLNKFNSLEKTSFS